MRVDLPDGAEEQGQQRERKVADLVVKRVARAALLLGRYVERECGVGSDEEGLCNRPNLPN